MGMDVGWPHKKRELGDEIVYTCPNGLLTWEGSLRTQLVRCIWHRQTDTMHWWPQNLHQCNSKYCGGYLVNIIILAPVPCTRHQASIFHTK